jgi:hypothetical protein
MKLSQVLKYSGKVVGGIAAIFIIWALLDLILVQKVALIFLGLGAVVYFIGVWLKKQGK